MAFVEMDIKMTSLEIFPQRINALLDSPTGPVGVAIQQQAEALLEAAKPLIGTTYSGHHPENPPMSSTGSVVSIGGSAWAVVFNHPAAFVHHEGTAGHPIKATKVITDKKNRTRILPMFRDSPTPTGTRGEPFGPAFNVQHPGTTGNPFLTNAAIQIGLRPSGGLKRGKRLAPIFRSSGQSF